jgi:hypothetical protein
MPANDSSCAIQDPPGLRAISYSTMQLDISMRLILLGEDDRAPQNGKASQIDASGLRTQLKKVDTRLKGKKSELAFLDGDDNVIREVTELVESAQSLYDMTFGKMDNASTATQAAFTTVDSTKSGSNAPSKPYSLGQGSTSER